MIGLSIVKVLDAMASRPGYWVLPVAMALTLLLSGAGLASAQNLVSNPGFEADAEGWTVEPGIMAIDSEENHGGKASLRLSWDEPGKRKLALQPIPCHPTKRYLIRAWLKSENVHGARLGATFGVEWNGKEGYIGGGYPMGVGWDTDWTQVSFLTRPVPKQATGAHVFATIDWGGVGAAWVDDVSVEVIDEPEILRWRLDADTVVGGRDSPPFRLAVVRVATEAFGEPVDIVFALHSPPWGHELTAMDAEALEGVTALFDTAELAQGRYEITACVKSRASGRNLVDREKRVVYKRPPLECFLKPHHAVLVQGDPWPSVSVRGYREGNLSGASMRDDGERLSAIATHELTTTDSSDIPFARGAAQPGRYHFRLTLEAKGHTSCECVVPFVVVGKDAAREGVVIRSDNVLHDRGKPWLPLFLYAHTAYEAGSGELQARKSDYTTELLDRLKGTPLGLLDYATPIGGLRQTVALADECAKRDVRLALSVKDVYPGWGNLDRRAKGFEGAPCEDIVRRLARALRDHPALAFYYTNDELSTEYFKAMTQMRQWLHEEDPLHPTLHVHYDLECIRELAPSYDMFGPELYPWPDSDLVKMVRWSDRTMRDLPQGAPFWGCLWHFKGDPQGSEKLRALAYLAVARGARGLLFYAYHELQADPRFEVRWLALVRLARELEQSCAILLQPQAPEPCVTDAEGIASRTVSGEEGTWLLAVNATGEPVTAVFKVPFAAPSAQAKGTSVPVRDGTLTLELQAFGVQLVRLS